MPDGHQNSSLLAVSGNAPWHRKHRRALIGAAGILLLVVAGGWFFHYWTVSRFLESTNNAYLRADAVVISPKIAGYVKEVLVGDNQTVTADQTLIRIDATPYQAAKDMAEADMAQRQADLVRFRADAARQQA